MMQVQICFKTLERTLQIHCNTLQHAATHCNALKYTTDKFKPTSKRSGKPAIVPPLEGMEAKQKMTKTKRTFGTKPKARAGWSKRLALVWATPRAKFAVVGVQRCWHSTAIFWYVALCWLDCSHLRILVDYGQNQKKPTIWIQMQFLRALGHFAPRQRLFVPKTLFVFVSLPSPRPWLLFAICKIMMKTQMILRFSGKVELQVEVQVEVKVRACRS